MQTLIDDVTRQRYELSLDGGIAFVDYRRNGKVVTLTHAEVPHEFEGRGVGSTLANLVLEEVRRRADKVIPRCSFIVAYMSRHSETHDLLADGVKLT